MKTNETVVPQNQAWPDRAPVMEKFFKKFFLEKTVNAIEIGVWYAMGSTNIWLENLAPGSQISLIDSWVPYASTDDLDDSGWDYRSMDELSTDAFLSAYLKVKRFETLKNKKDLSVNLIRAKSNVILKSFASDHFDFIYIDGDHKYSAVKNDILHAKRLIKKDFGIICGDDLEFFPTEELYTLSQKYTDRDYLRDSYNFHPGVLMAVYEEFPTVGMINGFWWVACINGEFVKLDFELDQCLSENPPQFDSHSTSFVVSESVCNDILSDASTDVVTNVSFLQDELIRANAQIKLLKDLWLNRRTHGHSTD